MKSQKDTTKRQSNWKTDQQKLFQLKKGEKKENKYKSLRGILITVKSSDIQITGILGTEKRNKGIKQIFEKIMTKNVSKTKSEIKIKREKSQKHPSSLMGQ